MQLPGLSLIILLSATTPLLAQQPPATDKPPVTVLTGCLRSSGADTAVAGPDGRLYTLEVTEAPAKPDATTTTGTTPPVASKTSYSLAAPASVGLAKHDGHEVQLTGSLQAPSTPATTSSPAGTPAPKPGGAHRTFNVTALKMIAAKCQ
jgi:hypothetical protein